MSKYPDWLKDRFDDNIPDWAEERWGNDEDKDKKWNKSGESLLLFSSKNGILYVWIKLIR